MTPFELTHQLARVHDRLLTAWTASAALVAFTAAAAPMHPVFGLMSFRLAVVLVATAALGAAVALGAVRYVLWQRDELRDAIVLTRFRHVGGDAVARHAERLIDPRRRAQAARGIRRFVESAVAGLPSPVPMNRPAIRVYAPRLEAIAAALGAVDQPVTPQAMVMIRRLITNGATSPLFYPVGDARDLEREIERIERELTAAEPGSVLALAA